MEERIKCVEGVVDCHTHSGAIDLNNYYHCRYPAMSSVKNLVDNMDENGVDYAVTFPMPSTIFYNVKEYWDKHRFVPSGMSDAPFAMENEYLLAEANYFGKGRVLPFLSISLNSNEKQQYKYIMNACLSNNVYGLKFHSKADQNSIEDLATKGDWVTKILADFNIPLVVHCENSGISSPISIFEYLAKKPGIRVSLAHYAGMSKRFFKEYDEYVKSYDNLFFDTAPSICMCRRYAEAYKDGIDDLLELDYSKPIDVNSYFLDKYNDYVLWGTDFPWLFSDNLKEKSEECVAYIDEINLRKRVEANGIRYSVKTINRFLFSLYEKL